VFFFFHHSELKCQRLIQKNTPEITVCFVQVKSWTSTITKFLLNIDISTHVPYGFA